jgi:hypothetical protein
VVWSLIYIKSAALYYESGHATVNETVIVFAAARVSEEIRYGLRGLIVGKFDIDVALVGAIGYFHAHDCVRSKKRRREH